MRALQSLMQHEQKHHDRHEAVLAFFFRSFGPQPVAGDRGHFHPHENIALVAVALHFGALAAEDFRESALYDADYDRRFRPRGEN